MGEEEGKEIVRSEHDIASFFNGAKVLLPALLTLIITGYGWYETSKKASVDKGIADQRLNQLEVTVAKLESSVVAVSEKANGHDVALGRIEVKLGNVEKVSNDTYILLYDFTRQR